MRNRKINLLIFILLGMALLFAGCSKKEKEPDIPETVPTPAATATPAPDKQPLPDTAAEPESESTPPQDEAQIPGGTYNADGSVIFEHDGVTVTAQGLKDDDYYGTGSPYIMLDISNTGSSDLWLVISDGCVNDVMCDVMLTQMEEEDGEYYNSGRTEYSMPIPAGSRGKYSIGYYDPHIPGIDLDTFAEAEFTFALSKDEYETPYISTGTICLETGMNAGSIDIASLGQAVVDDDELLIVFGEQEYDDWFGPKIYVYALNRSDKCLGVQADTADADGNLCDYMYYYARMAPGKISATTLTFDGDVRELKGIEDLKVDFSIGRAASLDGLNGYNPVDGRSASAVYPARVWGEYANGGYTFEIKPQYNDLLTVTTPQNDPDGILFTVSETASLEAGGYEGAGLLFSIGKVSTEKLHEMLCYEMGGAEVFAKDDAGSYFVCYYPSDSRYERSDAAELAAGEKQWDMLNQWAWSAGSDFAGQNALGEASYGNSDVDIYVARAAFMKDCNAVLSNGEFGKAPLKGIDGSKYADYIFKSWFMYTWSGEAPDCDYISLEFPGDDVRLDFFLVPDAYVRVVTGSDEMLYQAMWHDDLSYSCGDVIRGWYYAAAEKAGLKTADDSLEPFAGGWYEKIAGRGMITITPALAPGWADVYATWPDSAAVLNTWKMTASLSEEGSLVYKNCEYVQEEYDEDGMAWQLDSGWELTGEFFFNDDDELVWIDDHSENDEPGVFLRDDF